MLGINDYYLLEVNDRAAAKIIDGLALAVDSLADLAERGSVPKELLALGIAQYRQIIVKPFRIIYEALPERIIVHAILDGRRDIESLLTQRLVRFGQ